MKKILYPKNTKGTTKTKEKKKNKKSTSKDKNEKGKEQKIQNIKKDEIKLKDVDIEIPKTKKDSGEKVQLTKEILSNNIEEWNSEEKEEIYNNIKKEIEYDRKECESIIEDKSEKNVSNESNQVINKEKRKDKSYNIEVEEILDNETIDKDYEVIENKSKLEVKNKIFPKKHEIPINIYYDGKLFIKDRHNLKNYPININYRCKNYRKYEYSIGRNFCNAIVKRTILAEEIRYNLTQKHSDDCVKIIVNEIKNDTHIIESYKDYIDKCKKYLDSTEVYNKQEFTVALQNIYNENKYNFLLKENTIKNIIGSWKKDSLRFTKFNAIINKYNKKNKLILWDQGNTVIYLSNKKNPLTVEYFIWSTESIISRARVANHLFIDATFHHPKDYEELIIIIFKDIIIHEYLPGFYILVSSKSEQMYDIVFRSIYRILSQNNMYCLNIKTITTDTELALINAINSNFKES